MTVSAAASTAASSSVIAAGGGDRLLEREVHVLGGVVLVPESADPLHRLAPPRDQLLLVGRVSVQQLPDPSRSQLDVRQLVGLKVVRQLGDAAEPPLLRLLLPDAKR